MGLAMAAVAVAMAAAMAAARVACSGQACGSEDAGVALCSAEPVTGPWEPLGLPPLFLKGINWCAPYLHGTVLRCNSSVLLTNLLLLSHVVSLPTPGILFPSSSLVPSSTSARSLYELRQGKIHPPSMQDFRDLVGQDSALMAAAGVNVVSVLRCTSAPLHPATGELPADATAVRTYETITDTSVLDTLWTQGISVVSTVYSWAGKTKQQVIDDVAATKLQSASIRQGHPAIAMWAVGNEWNYNHLYYEGTLDFMQSLALVKEMVAAIKAEDPTRQVATVYGEVPDAATVAALPEVDVWGLNVYRGASFGNLFDAWASVLPPVSSLPMFLGEYGADAWNANLPGPDEPAQAFATSALTTEMLSHSSTGGGNCIGGFLFEFADEWWKDGAGAASQHDVGGVAPGGGPHPDFTFNEEWFGMVDVDRNPRLAYSAFADVDTNYQCACTEPWTGGGTNTPCTSSAPTPAPTVGPARAIVAPTPAAVFQQAQALDNCRPSSLPGVEVSWTLAGDLLTIAARFDGTLLALSGQWIALGLSPGGGTMQNIDLVIAYHNPSQDCIREMNADGPSMPADGSLLAFSGVIYERTASAYTLQFSVDASALPLSEYLGCESYQLVVAYGPLPGNPACDFPQLPKHSHRERIEINTFCDMTEPCLSNQNPVSVPNALPTAVLTIFPFVLSDPSLIPPAFPPAAVDPTPVPPVPPALPEIPRMSPTVPSRPSLPSPVPPFPPGLFPPPEPAFPPPLPSPPSLPSPLPPFPPGLVPPDLPVAPPAPPIPDAPAVTPILPTFDAPAVSNCIPGPIATVSWTLNAGKLSLSAVFPFTGNVEWVSGNPPPTEKRWVALGLSSPGQVNMEGIHLVLAYPSDDAPCTQPMTSSGLGVPTAGSLLSFFDVQYTPATGTDPQALSYTVQLADLPGMTDPNGCGPYELVIATGPAAGLQCPSLTLEKHSARARIDIATFCGSTQSCDSSPLAPFPPTLPSGDASPANPADPASPYFPASIFNPAGPSAPTNPVNPTSPSAIPSNLLTPDGSTVTRGPEPALISDSTTPGAVYTPMVSTPGTLPSADSMGTSDPDPPVPVPIGTLPAPAPTLAEPMYAYGTVPIPSLTAGTPDPSATLDPIMLAESILPTHCLHADRADPSSTVPVQSCVLAHLQYLSQSGNEGFETLLAMSEEDITALCGCNPDEAATLYHAIHLAGATPTPDALQVSAVTGQSQVVFWSGPGLVLTVSILVAATCFCSFVVLVVLFGCFRSREHSEMDSDSGSSDSEMGNMPYTISRHRSRPPNEDAPSVDAALAWGSTVSRVGTADRKELPGYGTRSADHVTVRRDHDGDSDWYSQGTVSMSRWDSGTVHGQQDTAYSSSIPGSVSRSSNSVPRHASTKMRGWNGILQDDSGNWGDQYGSGGQVLPPRPEGTIGNTVYKYMQYENGPSGPALPPPVMPRASMPSTLAL
eukprot:gene5240-131_t